MLNRIVINCNVTSTTATTSRVGKLTLMVLRELLPRDLLLHEHVPPLGRVLARVPVRRERARRRRRPPRARRGPHAAHAAHATDSGCLPRS